MIANESLTVVTRGKIGTKTEESRDAVPASANCVFCCGTELQSTINIFFFFFMTDGNVFIVPRQN